MRSTAFLLGLTLLAASLAGCIGGEDPGPALGTYDVQAADQAASGGGDHSEHAGAVGLQHAAELSHFNGTHGETFDHQGEELGLQLAWSLTGGSVTIQLLDDTGGEQLSVTASGEGSEEHIISPGAGSWTLNITGQDATGALAIDGGGPAELGMIQDEPITYEETLTFDTSSQDWTWTTKGNATLSLEGELATGTVTVKILDGAAMPLDPITIEGPAQISEAHPIEGVPGTWTVTLQTDMASGQLGFALAGAGDA